MKIAIKANPNRGEEILSFLESLGGINNKGWHGDGAVYTYYIDEDNSIQWCYSPADYKVYTLEEFEKKFPFKIGDKVRDCSDDEIGTILEFIDIDDELMYVVNFEKSGHANMPAEELKPYKEMERNITLTLDKAKEWYKKGGDLKQVALQAFSEKELNPLPRSWEEFCENYPVREGECYLKVDGEIHVIDHDSDTRICKNWIPSKKSAKAHIALIQLEQLRDCWRQGWKPTQHDTGYCITNYPKGYTIMSFSFISFLSFPTREMTEEFLECFRDLIEQAGDLI